MGNLISQQVFFHCCIAVSFFPTGIISMFVNVTAWAILLRVIGLVFSSFPFTSVLCLFAGQWSSCLLFADWCLLWALSFACSRCDFMLLLLISQWISHLWHGLHSPFLSCSSHDWQHSGFRQFFHRWVHTGHMMLSSSSSFALFTIMYCPLQMCQDFACRTVTCSLVIALSGPSLTSLSLIRRVFVSHLTASLLTCFVFFHRFLLLIVCAAKLIALSSLLLSDLCWIFPICW
jgi:hypothetical protein